MKRIAFYTLGCKLNFSESSGLAKQFSEKAYLLVDFKNEADIYVINTCTVTAIAEKKCRRAIALAIRRNPAAKIAVIGCFSEIEGETVAQIEGVHYVLGNADKYRLVEILEKENSHLEKNMKVGMQKSFHSFYSGEDRTRSFFKIQDGCDNFCSYCAIPFARGKSRSDTVESTVKKAMEIARNGTKEIILTGVNIGDFGRKNGESFFDLLQALEQNSDIERFRISSIEPDLLSEEIIAFVANSKKWMPHFHIPLQSGNNEILEEMCRHYKREFFADRVQLIKKYIPHAFVAADVITGFPSETPARFDDTYYFIESLPLSALHVFSYSARPNTPAANLKLHYESGEKKLRSAQLQSLSEKKKEIFYHSFKGEQMNILWEGDSPSRFMYGYTPNYIRVKAPYQADKINTISSFNLEILEKEKNKDWIYQSNKYEKRK